MVAPRIRSVPARTWTLDDPRSRRRDGAGRRRRAPGRRRDGDAARAASRSESPTWATSGSVYVHQGIGERAARTRPRERRTRMTMRAPPHPAVGVELVRRAHVAGRVPIRGLVVRRRSVDGHPRRAKSSATPTTSRPRPSTLGAGRRRRGWPSPPGATAAPPEVTSIARSGRRARRARRGPEPQSTPSRDSARAIAARGSGASRRICRRLQRPAAAPSRANACARLAADRAAPITAGRRRQLGSARRPSRS